MNTVNPIIRHDHWAVVAYESTVLLPVSSGIMDSIKIRSVSRSILLATGTCDQTASCELHGSSSATATNTRLADAWVEQTEIVRMGAKYSVRRI